MKGFQQELQSRILNVIPELSIEHQNFSQAFSLNELMPSIESFLQNNIQHSSEIRPFVGGDALLSQDAYSYAIELKGVDVSLDNTLYIEQGRWL